MTTEFPKETAEGRREERRREGKRREGCYVCSNARECVIRNQTKGRHINKYFNLLRILNEKAQPEFFRSLSSYYINNPS